MPPKPSIDDLKRVSVAGGRRIGAIFATFGLTIIGAIVLIFLPIWLWYWWRIEPGAREVAVLIRKTGSDLPSGDVLALQPGQKGIQLNVLTAGRYFYNPYTWDWKIVPITEIPAGRLGVKIRLYGKEPAPGQILADAESKGILAEILKPGTHLVNPYAYQVQTFDATTITPGCVGVQTSLLGRDTLTGVMPEEQNGSFTVGDDMKGVLTKVLDPGTYYLNPYQVTVVEVNLQSQRFELGGDDAISFLTMDGFTVIVEGTIEFSIQRDHAALLTHQVGEMDDILKKIILPRARGFSRIEGSKSPAISYIVGETRQQFQDRLEVDLRDKCKSWGIEIKSVLIRNISPPDAIASVIRDREVAVQNAKKFEQQIESARSQAELTKQEMLAQQNKEKVQAETMRIRATILAAQEQAVQKTAAERELEVARIENEAASSLAEAIRLKAQADQEVVRLRNVAEAGVIQEQMKAFKTGHALARYVLYLKLGPRIASILSTDQADGLGGLFLPFLSPPPAPPRAPPAAPKKEVTP